MSDANRAEPLEHVAVTSRGYNIFRQANGAGGHSYWSDAIAGGVIIYDSCLASREEIETALRVEKERSGQENAPRLTGTIAEIPYTLLLRRAVRNARSKATRGYHPRWVAVMQLFALGSGYAQQLCRLVGIDPDEMVRR